MFDRLTLSGAACSVLCCTTLAFAQEGCSPPANGARNPGVLYYSGGQFGTTAAPLASHSTVTIGQGPRSLELVYLIPNAGSPVRPGILVVKVARQNLASGFPGGASTVHIQRDAYPYVCGVPNIRAAGYAAGGFFGFSFSFSPVDNDVSLRDYVFYHKTTADYTQAALYNFHVNYRDFKGVCTRTDDKRNGNREQFLYGSHRELSNSIVWRRVITGATAAAAEAAKNVPYGEYFAERVQEAAKTAEEASQVTAVDRKYSQLETQIHPYSTANSSCVSFEISNVQSGQKVKITLNDLEQREPGGKRLKPRVEQTFVFTAQ